MLSNDVSKRLAATALFVSMLATRDVAACLAPATCPQATLNTIDRVPANSPALYFGRTYNAYIGLTRTTLRSLQLVELTAGGEIPVDAEISDGPFFGHLLRLTAPLVEGHTYRIDGTLSCTGLPLVPSASRTFTPVAAAPIPATLGSLRVSAPTDGPLEVFSRAIGTGSCGQRFQARWIDVFVELSPEARPWSSTLLYETTVDGAVWRPVSHGGIDVSPERSWTGAGTDRIYVACGRVSDWDPNYSTPVPGVEPGVHRVRFRAWIPGQDAPIVSEIAEIELQCPPRPDVITTDASSDVPPSDDVPSATPMDASTSPRLSGGGACTISRTTRTPTALPSLLMALSFLTYRRRRKSN